MDFKSKLYLSTKEETVILKVFSFKYCTRSSLLQSRNFLGTKLLKSFKKSRHLQKPNEGASPAASASSMVKRKVLLIKGTYFSMLWFLTIETKPLPFL